MRTRTVAVTAALGLALAALTPLTAATAADLTVTGIVTLDGAVAPSVEVGWYDPATRESGETVAAADGSYSLTISDTHSYVLYAGINRDEGSWKTVGGDNYVGVFVGAGSKTDYLFQGLPLITGVPASGAIDLDKPGTITGPALGAKSISFLTGGHDLRKTVKPDASGNYSVTGLIPGTYFAEADPTDKKKDRFFSGAITVAAATPTVFAPDFSVRSTGTVTGLVKSGGKPVKGIRVTATTSVFGDSDVTDSKGRYSISHLPAQKYDLYFAMPGEGEQPGTYRTEITSATVAIATKTTVNQSLEKGGAVTGSVVRPAKAKYFKVIVLDPKDRIVGGTTFAFDTKKAATTFTLKGVRKGADRTVVVADTDEKLYTTKKVDVDSSVSVGSVSLTKKTLTISGSVKGAKSGIVSYGFGSSGGAYIGYLASYSATIKNGKYTVKGVLPGKAVLTTQVKDRANKTVTINVTKSKTKTLKVGATEVFPMVTGTFLVDGRTLPLGDVTFGKDNRDYGEGGYANIVNSVITKSLVVPNKTWIMHLDTTSVIKEFQTDSPFYLSIPAEVSRVKLAPNTSKDFGTVNLTINR